MQPPSEINPPGAPLEQRMFVVPVRLLQPNQQQQQASQEEQQQAQIQKQQRQIEEQAGLLQHLQQQQLADSEEVTLQPISFDTFHPLPMKEVLRLLKTPSGVVTKMPPRPQSGTVWRFDNAGSNKDNWKAQMYQWVEPGEKNSNSSGMLQCIFWD